MMMEILERLFGGKNRVKTMRLFLFHGDTSFSVKEIAEKINARTEDINSEVNFFERIGFLKEGKNREHKRSFLLNTSFPFITPIKDLLLKESLVSEKEMIGKFSKLGKIKLLILSGVFINYEDARLDIFVVGDDIGELAIGRTIKNLESEIGTELKYAFFSTAEFKYRFGMYDKLIMDILDFPHRKILDKIGV